MSPEDPVSELLSAAIAVHEMYTTFQAAGFTKKEALYLVGQSLQSMTRRELDEETDSL
jgi:hypothetical protein